MKILKARKKLIFIIILILLFFFRLAFGLCADFRPDIGDERQIYLIGLKFFTTGEWSYFGPDVTNTIQIPGALQGLVVGLPFFILPIPEAPYIFLNILSFLSLCFFAWYCTKRLANIPPTLIWLWLLTCPWTLNISTQVYNPSYVLTGSILFFIGAIETYPFLKGNIISLRLANFMMGFAFFWVMQLHLSWIILVPYLLVSIYFQFKTRGIAVLSHLVWFMCGAAITGSLLVPTFLKYGLVGGMGSTNEAVQFNLLDLSRHLKIIGAVLGRFLSFASFELPRFIGNNTAARFAFLEIHPWLIPFVIFLAVVGFLQPAALFFLWFSKKHKQKDWKAIKFLTLLTVILLYISFLFSMKPPLSHTFYVTFPVAMLYSLYCWDIYLVKPFWRKFAYLILISGIIFHAGLAIHNYSRISMYLEHKKITDAIDNNNYHLLDERHSGARY